MKSFQTRLGFARIGIVLAAPFALLACGFGAAAIYQLALSSAGDAARHGSYALLFLVLGAILYFCIRGLGRMMSSALSDDP